MGLAHTNKTETFAATVVFDNTRKCNSLRFTSEQFFRHKMNQLNVGDPLTVMITNKRPKRTVSQNNYYWGVYLALIAKETGHTIDELHKRFTEEFLLMSRATVLGKEVKVIKSTSNLSVSDFIEYVMNIEALTGIAAPPTENYFLEPLKPKLKMP